MLNQSEESALSFIDQTIERMVDTSDEAMLLFKDGIIIRANAAADRVYRLPKGEDLIGRSLIEFSPKKQSDGKSSQETVEKRVKTAMDGYVQSFEFKHLHADGTPFDARVTLTQVIYKGEPIILGQITDITMMKQQQAKMAYIIEENPAMMLTYNPEFKIIHANRKAPALLGYSNETLLNMKVSDFSIFERSGGSITEIFSTKSIVVGELGADTPKGKVYLRYHYLPMINDDGEIKEIIGIYFDQTEMISLKKRSDYIFEENPAYIIIYNRDFQIKTVNKAWVEASGYTREELQIMSLKDFKTFDRSGGSPLEVIESGRVISGEVGIEVPKGIIYVRFFYLPMISSTGRTEEILAVYFDITELKILQNRLEESIIDLAVGLATLSEKDLTISIEVKDDDLLCEVKKDFNRAVRELQSVLSAIFSESDSLEESILEVNKGSDDLAHGATEVARTSQKSANDISNQMHELEMVTREISDLSASIEEIAASAIDVRTITEKVVTAGCEAQQLGKDASSQMKIVETISRSAVEQIRDLNSRMQEIGKIIRVIRDIANQTNLLALNAAIEAARAGEHGRGFAVVAGEVKNLAGEARDATQSIEEVIQGLMQGSIQTADAIEKAYGAIVSGISSVSSTITALDIMVKDAEVATGSAADISRATESQAAGTNRVNQTVEAVYHMISEDHKNIATLAAIAEESSASTEKIASAASEVLAMSKRLKNQINTFTLTNKK